MGFNGNQRPGGINGVSPLIYQGSTPNMVTFNRRPTVQDGFSWPIGMWWIIPVDLTFTTGEVWNLVSKEQGINTWKKLQGHSQSAETLTGNTGGAVSPDTSNNINIVGTGALTVSGNPGSHTLTIAYSGSSGGITSILKTYITTPGAGTYTPTAGMAQCYVECVGGGGGGGEESGVTGPRYGAAGGGGSYSAKLFTAADIGASKAYVVGAGGAPGATGATGGTSTFGAFLSSAGGTGGASGSAGVAAGIGGTATGGSINIRGGAGLNATVSADSTYYGLSGSSVYGQSVQTTSGNGLGAGITGVNGEYGSGGGGAVDVGAPAHATGGSGGDGIIIITEYIG